MKPDSWFGAVDIVHCVPGRVRLRYHRRSDIPENAAMLQGAVAGLPGVTSARVNSRTKSVILNYDPDQTDATLLQRTLADFSAPATVASGRPARAEAKPSAVMASFATPARHRLSLPRPLQFPLTLAAALPLLKHAAADYGRVGVTSHVLEGLAVSISLARGDYTAANTTTCMLALGDYMETSIARRSDDLLKHLLHPSSDKIWVMRDGEEVQILAAGVAVGETVIVGSGSVIPVDGTILGGEATINEAAMTGESAPVVKARGDSVLSGTLLEEGRLSIYAEHVGEGTTAARIAEYVEQSLVTKSEAQLDAARLADRLVPTVLKLAGASYLLSGDWRRAAAVLQADYSCALKLATPVAFKSAMYGAGQCGILIKGASALERLAQADTFVFDKTGTLTTGSLEVADAITFDSTYSPDDLICLAASVEEHYFHPLAMAVVAAARATHNRHFAHQEVQFIVAHGVASAIDGKRIVVGSQHFVQEDETSTSAPTATSSTGFSKKARPCCSSASAASCWRAGAEGQRPRRQRRNDPAPSPIGGPGRSSC